MKKSTRILALALAFVLLVSAFPFTNVSAASSSEYWEFVAQKRIPVFLDRELSARGTANPLKQYQAYADPGDLCRLYLLSGNTAGIGYPTPQGMRYGYASREDVLGCTHPSEEAVCRGQVTTYRSPGGKSFGYVSQNDIVYKLYQTGNYVCIVYPAPSGDRTFKIAFVTVNDYNSKIADTPTTQDGPILSGSAISTAASRYGIEANSNAYRALESINSKYGSQLPSSGTLIFLFEGVGSTTSAARHMNAMCIVVKNGNIVYLNRNSSTIPDYPFNPSKNGGDDMPTIKSGIYNFSTVNHRGSYAALNVNSAKVIRFASETSFYDSTSSAINVHRRSSDSIAPSSAGWVNSAGCQLVGASGTGSGDEYARFIQAVGIVNSSARGDVKYANSVSGKIVIDRTYAADYLASIGYSSGAITRIG